jgi:hypothetical protein
MIGARAAVGYRIWFLAQKITKISKFDNRLKISQNLRFM